MIKKLLEKWKRRKLSKKNVYTLSFRKSPTYNNDGDYTQICDWVIVEIINSLKKKYDVDICNIEVHDSYIYSKVVIRCAERVKIDFVDDFMSELGHYVRDISI